MVLTPIPTTDADRSAVAAVLEDCVADGLDLHAQIKVAHWNVKGPHFAALHPLFETFATDLARHGDAIAERAVMLGAVVRGTVRDAAARSRLPDWPGATRDLEQVALLLDRIERYMGGVHAARRVAEEHGDPDTVDLLTEVVATFDKHAWFLRSTLA